MATGDDLKDTTGPEFLDDLLLDEPGVTSSSRRSSTRGRPRSATSTYAIHHKARSWKDEDGLRDDAREGREALAKQQEETRKWRKRAEAAEARLGKSATSV